MQILYMNPAALKMDASYAMQHDQAYDDQPAIVDSTQSPNGTPHHAFSGSFDFTLPATSSYDHQHQYGNPPFQSFSAPPQLHPLNTTTLWPSQLTNPSPPMVSSPPNAVPLQPRPLAPLTQEGSKEPAPVASTSPPPSRATQNLSTSRKTLTDADRRKMCKFHEENPNTKQTEIGSMFGVERSTVSKVLRNKEKYLASDDGHTSPTHNNKKQKSKRADVERTLANWAKKRQLEGLPTDDDILTDEARKYVASLPDAESTSQVIDRAWIESFKLNYLTSKSRGERSKGSSKASQIVATSSPPLGWDGTPLSAGTDGIKTRSPVSGFSEGTLWGHGHTQSTASYSSVMSDAGFSTDYRGPASPGLFSPVTSSDPSPSMPAPKIPRLPTLAPAKLQRRQTVPHVSGAEDHADLAMHHHGLPGTSANDIGMDISPIAVNTSMVQPSRPSTVPSHNSFLNSASTNNTTSPFSTYPPSTASLSTNFSPSLGSGTSPPSTTSPSAPPSSDEALAALETIQKFLKHQPDGALDQHDWIVMAKWVQMLRIEGQNPSGGKYVMPMNERGDGTAPLGRKRSEHSLS